MKEPFDPVNKPEHYADGKIECIDAIEAATKELTGINSVCVANVIKYLWRAGKKDPSKTLEDVKKAQWFLERYISNLEA